jgi:hypothetical protein
MHLSLLKDGINKRRYRGSARQNNQNPEKKQCENNRQQPEFFPGFQKTP